ncbi:MAG: hypothetical protein Fur0018_10840 [Anaerolineales bacterium]
MKIRLSHYFTWTAGIVLWALMITQGLQALRVFEQRVVAVGLVRTISLWPGEIVLRHQLSVLIAGFALVFAGVLVFWILLPHTAFARLLSLPAPRLQAIATLAAVVLAGLRIALQIATATMWDFVWSGLAVSLVFLTFPVMISLYRGQARTAGFPLALGLLMGFLLDSVWHTALWTLASNWYAGGTELAVAVIVALLQVTLAIVWYHRAAISRHRPLHTLSLGQLWLAVFLLQYLTQHFGLFQVRTGWEWPTGLHWLLSADVVALALLIWLHNRYPRRYGLWLLRADLSLAAGILVTLWGRGLGFALGIFVVHVALIIHVSLVLKRMDDMQISAHLSHLQGGVLYLGFTALYVFLGASIFVIPLVGASLLWVTWRDGLWQLPDPLEKTTPYLPLPVAPLWGVMVLMFALSLWFSWQPTQASVPPPDAAQVRVMYLNIHQGMDSMGEVALSRVADLIEASHVDVLALNEASREWPSGGFDVPLWLAHRLGWQFIYGPDVGDLSGNAILSRYPLQLVDASRNQKWPFSPGGFLTGVIQTQHGPLYIATLHLDWGPPGTLDDRRAAALQTYLTQNADLLPRLLIGGDFNTDEAVARQPLLEAGLRNVWEGDLPAYTWFSSNLQRLLDFVFVSPQLTVTQRQVLSVDVSDHLPLVVDIVP